ncbi:MAG: hypothetical protein JWM98_1817 [Thermoleophilia bacterium]|nr:hypothetical protein [Thermoleophilia bacterium]
MADTRARQWYWDKDALAEALTKHGSLNRVAAATGVARNTLQTWSRKHELRSGHRCTPGGGDADPSVTPVVREVEPAELVTMRRAIDRKDAELRSLRVEVKHLAKRENLLEDIRDLMAPALTGLALPPPKPLPERRRGRRKPLTLVWHATDIHWGEIVEARTIQGINAYSPDIAAMRLQHTVDTIMRIADNYEAEHGVDEIVYVENGDGIGGSIHPDSAEYYARAGKQTVDFSMVQAQILTELASRFKRVRYIGTTGNHPRTQAHRMPTGSSRQQTSWESLVHEMTAALVSKIPNISFELAQGYTITTQIGPSRWAFSHGDAARGGGGSLGIPAYGLKKQHDATREWSLVLAQLAAESINSVVRHSRYGHFHTLFYWVAGAADIGLCPSPKGVDSFVLDSLGKYGPPQFLVEAVHPDHDLIAQHPIDLTSIGAGKSRYAWGAMESDQPAAKLLAALDGAA